MKKTVMLFAMLLATLFAMAKPVSQQEALRVAQTWLQARGMKNVDALQDITAQTPFTEFYVFAAEEGGYALVSADDCARPVLGYSTTSRFVVKDIPEHVRAFLAGYEKEIRSLKRPVTAMGRVFMVEGSNPDGRPAAWEALLSGVGTKDAGYTPVAPLMTTTWNQSPYYNDQCPSDERGQAVTGCVATATAQVMKYHNHPTVGYGSHTYSSSRVVNGESYDYPNLTANFGATTYQWSQMPNALSSSSSAAEVNAVATLMYHIGVADEMHYSPMASGAQNYYGGSVNRFRASSQASLAKYFKYSPDMAALERCAYSDDEFCAILRGEIAQLRPILFSGSEPSGGHSFVFDGYDADGYFHVNWGWGGSNDDYYAIGALNPGSGGVGGNATYTFNNDNVALIGIRPNTAWNTTGTTAITASVQSGAPSGSSVAIYNITTGATATSFNFCDTAQMVVTLPEGYRFSGWSDGCSFNPREIIATGGSYTFTANCTAIGNSDTMFYCIGDLQSLSSYTGGVKFPASSLNPSKQLTHVLFYPYTGGTYSVTVYTGANHETVAATESITVADTNSETWQTVALTTPVAATSDIWILFSSTDANYPVSLTNYSGVPSSLLLGEEMTEYAHYWGRSAMIKGVFGSDVVTNGDTVSYCGNNTPSVGGVGTPGGGAFQWGIKLLPHAVPGNYLKSVMLYVLDAFTGDYTLNVYRGGDNEPSTLVYSHTFNFTTTGWNEAVLDAPVTIDNQNLWITFSTSGMTYPMATCEYVGASNSDWLYNEGDWLHITALGLNYSWLIKAVGSDTPGTYPPPTVTISGQDQVAKGHMYTFSAMAPEGANITWAMQGASPSMTAGPTATTRWNTPGVYNVIATATTSYGIGKDTLQVHVVDYTVGDTVSYVLNRPHMTNIGTGASADLGWGIMMPADFLTGRTHLSAVLVGVGGIGSYNLTVYQGGDVAPQTQKATYTFNTTAADTASGHYYTYTMTEPLAISSDSNLWVVFNTTTLPYPAGCTYTTTDTNSDWTLLNGVWRHLSQLGIPGSWEIKLVMVEPQPEQYTITVLSNNPDWGTVSGGGTFDAGSTRQITATPTEGNYYFVKWDDENTDNPRTIVVNADATYTAIFADGVGIDEAEGAALTLTPNPASTEVTVNGLKTGSKVSVMDVSGRAVLTRAVKQSDNQSITLDVSQLPRGVYFVRVSDGSATAVRKLIVK